MLSEEGRLRALESYQLLDTLEEATYDVFTFLARTIAGTSISTITLIDEHRQWFKSHSGIDLRETPREISFCAHVVSSGKRMVVPDTRKDERFSQNPLVAGEPHLRFYAGVPLRTPEGYTIGALCVMDTQVRDITPGQLRSIEALATALFAALEARRRFRTLFDVVNIDVFAVDPSNGTIVFASRGACTSLGYSLAELSAVPINDVLPQYGPAQLRDMALQARGGDSSVYLSELRRRDGTVYPAELRIDLAHEQNEERLIVIAFDLTHRIAQEREIRLLLEAINVAGDAILVYSVDAKGELALSYMNDAYVKQSGYTREEAIGRSMESFRAGMPDDEGMRVVRGALLSGEPVQAEIVSYRKDQSTFWNQVTMHPIVDGAGRITHWVSIERDITEEVNRTSALAEEHDRLLALTLAARRLFTTLDARSLVETVRNVVSELLPAHCRVLAVSQDDRAIEIQEIGGVDWTDAFSDDLVSAALQHKMRAIAETHDRAVTYVGRFGEARYVLELRAHASRLFRNTDLFVFDLIAEYFAVAARNVTLYHELDERRSAVLELSQTKSDLIAMLAHDFRGPLTTIVGFADLVGEIGAVSEEQQEFLDTIKRSALQLAELATDTLTLARLERNEVSLQIGDVDLAELLRTTIAQQGERRTVHLEASGDAHIAGDNDRLRQVFANIIDNAIKYSPNGSPVRVELSGTPDSVRIDVRDTGIGIPAGELSRVFDRFSRASNAKKLRISGTGFGLFLSKQLVQLHGGTIAVESIEGTGSTITVTLPRRIARRSSPRTVVLLDRDGDRSFLAHNIREAGYRALTVDDLDELLAMADAQPIDALILSVSEGELTSAKAAQFRAFGRERAIPIIAIANHVIPRLGAYLTLSRPVMASDVIAALEAHLGFAVF